ncbi:MAG: hypothetical protein ACT4N5_04420 [Nitrosopumilaceae archaeon]
MTLKKENKKTILVTFIALTILTGISNLHPNVYADVVLGTADPNAEPVISVAVVPITQQFQYSSLSKTITVYHGVDTQIFDFPTTIVIGGFIVDPGTARMTLISADAQEGCPQGGGASIINAVTFNGSLLGDLVGADGSPPTRCLWDTFTNDVSSFVAPGDISATVEIDTLGAVTDCLTHQAIVFEEGTGGVGYAAAGVGLRNLDQGTITISGIPAGAIPIQSLLYWNYLDDVDQGGDITVDGNPVAGNLIGTDVSPCWSGDTSFGYYADVTSLVPGNGSYVIAGFPTGDSTGTDPWDDSPAPNMEGASLVVVYQEAECSADGKICKFVEILDDDGDGIIEVGEVITYTFHIIVSNNSGQNWTNVVVKDNFGGDLDVIDPLDPDVTLTLKGKTAKESLSWNVGSLNDGQSEELVLTVVTDQNPAGNQEYTSCSYHDINSGATVKYKDENNKQQSASTGSITVSVLTEDALGDCDGDGFSDQDELELATDPHVAEDYPGCGGINTQDICVDGDGTTSALAGTFSVVWGNPLASWPTGFDVEGLDWFDNDASCTWTGGDDLHVEGSAYPTASRNTVHDSNLTFVDPLVLDIDASLVDLQPVDVDLETGTAFTGCLGVDPLLKFNDADLSTNWDDGEDIILDINGNGIFD